MPRWVHFWNKRKNVGHYSIRLCLQALLWNCRDIYYCCFPKFPLSVYHDKVLNVVTCAGCRMCCCETVVKLRLDITLG